ncbi:MAG TPA: ribonuclease P protein component [Woeseiaceae bacterium]
MTTTIKDNNKGCAPSARIHRLPDAAAYSRVFGGARRSRDHLFIVLARANGTDTARLGLAIAKKNCRLATGRNRLKRIVRESFRRQQGELAGLDIVVLAQRDASRMDNATLFDSLAKHWQKTRSANAAATSAKTPTGPGLDG